MHTEIHDFEVFDILCYLTFKLKNVYFKFLSYFNLKFGILGVFCKSKTI